MVQEKVILLKPLQVGQDEDFHEVIAERYERRNTIASNLDIPEWVEVFPNRILGAATIDRLRHGAYKVVLEGKSYRSSQPVSKAQNTSSLNQKNELKINQKGGDKS